ncbi:MAG: hypothetical protein M3O61_03620 [Gemmatimonadota bacterium]|nr:hypothetical protein [Gemmatimonadota bacterium]
MIFDAQNYLSDGQVLVASGASTNSIAIGAANRRLFGGELLRFLVWLDAEAKDSDANETYTVKAQTDDNEGFLSPTDISPATTIPRGSAVGARFYVEASRDALVNGFIRLYFTLGGTDPDVSVSAVLLPEEWSAGVHGANDGNAFPIGYTVA